MPFEKIIYALASTVNQTMKLGDDVEIDSFNFYSTI